MWEKQLWFKSPISSLQRLLQPPSERERMRSHLAGSLFLSGCPFLSPSKSCLITDGKCRLGHKLSGQCLCLSRMGTCCVFSFFFFLSVSQKFILLVSDKGRALGRGRNQPLTLLHQSLRLHPADTPTSPGLGESEMTQGPDVLLSRESADADTEGREHLEFCLFSSTKTSTAQKKGARPWAAPS